MFSSLISGQRFRTKDKEEKYFVPSIVGDMFLGLPVPDPLVRDMDPDPAPDTSIFS